MWASVRGEARGWGGKGTRSRALKLSGFPFPIGSAGPELLWPRAATVTCQKNHNQRLLLQSWNAHSPAWVSNIFGFFFRGGDICVPSFNQNLTGQTNVENTELPLPGWDLGKEQFIL